MARRLSLPCIAQAEAGARRCRYIRYWTPVKIRWHLHVTSAERARLAGLAQACPTTTLTVPRATIRYR